MHIYRTAVSLIVGFWSVAINILTPEFCLSGFLILKALKNVDLLKMRSLSVGCIASEIYMLNSRSWIRKISSKMQRNCQARICQAKPSYSSLFIIVTVKKMENPLLRACF